MSTPTPNEEEAHETVHDGDALPDIEIVFQEAIHEFYNNLSDEERELFRGFRRAEDLIEHLRSETLEVPQLPRTMDRVCGAIGGLAHSLEPYFAIINTFIQSNPEIASLFWGSVRLVFQVSTNYTAFVERLSEFLDDIAQELSFSTHAYQNYLLRARDLAVEAGQNRGQKKVQSWERFQSWERLARAISDLYRDLLAMCRRICDMFSTKRRGNLHKRILETALREANADAFVAALIATRQSIISEETQLATIALEMKMSRLASLKTWLDSDPWQPPFEQAKANRKATTALWILENSDLKWWCESQSRDLPQLESRKNGLGRTLLIHGKPGYGKSVLCATIIENLRSQPKGNATDPRALCDIGEVDFYFFDKQRPLVNNAHAAFRAIVTQLLHSQQDFNDLIDLAILMRDTKGYGQSTASDEEVSSLMGLYLEKLEETRLVFDGLDECSNVETFLSSLRKIVGTSNTHILFCSRPNITVNDAFPVNTRTLVLHELANFEDIETYLRPELRSLVDSEKLIIDEPIDLICHRIAQTSQSMFLWANLMVNYLKSDFLTPQDRIDAIEEVGLFEELDQFYAKILQQLYRRCGGPRARTNLQRLFHWVTMAMKPLTVPEMRSALAIQIGSPTKKSSYIPRFETTIVKMSGALVEMSVDKTIRFIHASVWEFFTSVQDPSNLLGLQTRNLMVIDISAVHGTLALECISYILHDYPNVPLKSTFAHRPQPKEILRKFPFILYAIQFWAVHSGKSFEICHHHQQQQGNSARSGLFSMLRKLMHEKRAVTAWTELMWAFSLEPQLADLQMKAGATSNAVAEDVVATIQAFAKDLQRLNTEWGKVLCDDPDEIWQPSIPAFMKSRFWVSTKESTTVTLDVNTNQLSFTSGDNQVRPILVASQTSSDGIHNGLVKLWPSREFAANVADPSFNNSVLEQHVEYFSRNWTVRYNVTLIRDQRVTRSIEVELPSDPVAVVLRRAARAARPGRFEFPVSFSRDLQQLTILTFIIRINIQDLVEEPSLSKFSVQTLQLPFSPESCPYLDHSNASYFFPCPCQCDWYRMTFSPSGRYLAILRGVDAPGDMTERILTVYEDPNTDSKEPNFIHVAESTTKIAMAVTKSHFLFHPCEPLIVVSCLGVTALWSFSKPRPRWINIADTPLDNLSFSPCGNYVLGIIIGIPGQGQFMCVNIEAKVRQMKALIQPIPNTIAGHIPRDEGGVLPMQEHNVSLANSKAATTDGNTVTFNNTGTAQQFSLLRQYNEEGAILFRQVNESGVVVEQCLTRLPSASTLAMSHATLLSAFSESKCVGVVLDKSAQHTYSFNERDDVELPLLITRYQDSIPTRTYKRPLAIDERETSEKQKKERLLTSLSFF